MATRPDERVERLIRAAEVHGRLSHPDHEVGDLQGILRSCWEQLGPEARERVVREAEHVLGWLQDDPEDAAAQRD